MQGNVKATLLGPESPHVSKIRNFYIKEILIKISRKNPDLDAVKIAIRKATTELNTEKEFRSVIVYADVDPG